MGGEGRERGGGCAGAEPSGARLGEVGLSCQGRGREGGEGAHQGEVDSGRHRRGLDTGAAGRGCAVGENKGRGTATEEGEGREREALHGRENEEILDTTM
jgi:hypothetical protein